MHRLQSNYSAQTNCLLYRFIVPLASVRLRLFNTDLTGLRFHLDQNNHKKSLSLNANAYNKCTMCLTYTLPLK